ncbi:hypothetical protein ABPG77_007676 [Micractinium sp. CCAP 211/92]
MQSALRKASHLASVQQLGSQWAAGWAAQQSSGFSSLVLGSWWRNGATESAVPAAALGWQRLAGLLPSSLADSQLLAAPKKKVSPHRRGNRNATKYIRFVPVVAQCSKCQRVFQQQSVPSKCDEDDCPAFNLRARPEESTA